MMTRHRYAWLCELLRDALKSPRLNRFESWFITDYDRRVTREGSDADLSPAQLKTLEQIEEKIHAAG